MNPQTLQNGQEQHTRYTSSIRKQQLVRYDYRDHDGKLFSCIRPTLDECRAKRDEWLEKKRGAAS